MITAKSINPAKLDRRVSLRYPVDTKSNTGAILKSWVLSDTIWAGWIPLNGREMAAAQSLYAEASGVFRIRHRADVDTTWQLVNGDDLFAVVALEEVGRREYLDLVVKSLSQSLGAALSVRMLHDGSPRTQHDGGLTLMHTAA